MIAKERPMEFRRGSAWLIILLLGSLGGCGDDGGSAGDGGGETDGGTDGADTGSSSDATPDTSVSDSRPPPRDTSMPPVFSCEPGCGDDELCGPDGEGDGNDDDCDGTVDEE